MQLGRFLALSFLGVLMMPVLFSAPRVALAQSISTDYGDIQDQGLIFAGICDSSSADCACRDEGDCTLADILQVFVNIGTFILAICGSVILLVFTYGGFLWIIARGDPKYIQKGKDAMVGSIIGLFIILGAYAGVNLLLGILKNGAAPSTGQNIEDTVGSDVIDTR